MGRKQKKYHFIYKTTCTVNNKFYVGMHSTDNLEDGYIGSGKRLWYSIKKYGRENFTFEILEHLPNREELVKREIELVNEEYLKDTLCLNLKLGGQGGLSGLDETTREKIRQGASKYQKEKWLDIDYSDKIKKSLRNSMIKNHSDGKYRYDTFKGKTHSDETKKLMSETKKGKKTGSENSQFGTCWITNEKENKKIKKGDLIPDGWRLGRQTKKLM